MQTRFINKHVDREWLDNTFPCMMACPAHTNAGRYVALIAEGKFEEAYRVARDPNPLASVCGRVCAHPCETACRRGAIDKPIAIRALKRFLTERHGPESLHPVDVEPSLAEKLPFRVGIVGAGPVGLSAAHDLARLGYSVTIFEASHVPGGMLALGIPEYRLPRNVVEAQVREILSGGDIELKLNRAAGRDFTIAGLRRDGFDAVVIAVGAHRSRDLSIPGIDTDGVLKGIDFLLNANLGYRFQIGKRVVVIGGGNVAMDVARSAAREIVKQHSGVDNPVDVNDENVAAAAAKEMMDVSLSALRMGAHEVNIVCLERREEMPAALEEIEEAETEGVVMHAGFGPKRVLVTNGRVSGLEVLETKSLVDENGRFSPTFNEGTESAIECDTIILAVGQAANLEFLAPEDGVAVSARGLIIADRNSLMTSAAGVFAGGDCVFGPRLIIDSVADGKRIAMGIDAYLQGRQHPDPEIEIQILDRHHMFGDFMNITRQDVPMLPLDRRTGVTEVEVGYDEQSAIAEAQRCLHCWVNTVFEGNEADASACILCGGCVDVCPESCLSLVPLQSVEFPSGVVAHIEGHFDLYDLELYDVAPDQLETTAGSVMLKDETRCIRCGLCAARCPVNTITMEAYRWVIKDPSGLVPLTVFSPQ